MGNSKRIEPSGLDSSGTHRKSITTLGDSISLTGIPEKDKAFTIGYRVVNVLLQQQDEKGNNIGREFLETVSVGVGDDSWNKQRLQELLRLLATDLYIPPNEEEEIADLTLKYITEDPRFNQQAQLNSLENPTDPDSLVKSLRRTIPRIG